MTRRTPASARSTSLRAPPESRRLRFLDPPPAARQRGSTAPARRMARSRGHTSPVRSACGSARHGRKDTTPSSSGSRLEPVLHDRHPASAGRDLPFSIARSPSSPRPAGHRPTIRATPQPRPASAHSGTPHRAFLGPTQATALRLMPIDPRPTPASTNGPAHLGFLAVRPASTRRRATEQAE